MRGLYLTLSMRTGLIRKVSANIEMQARLAEVAAVDCDAQRLYRYNTPQVNMLDGIGTIIA